MRKAFSYLKLFLWAETLSFLTFFYLYHERTYQQVKRVFVLKPDLSPHLATASRCQVKAELSCPRRLKLHARNFYASLSPLPQVPGRASAAVSLYAPRACKLLAYQPQHCVFYLESLYSRSLGIKLVSLDFNMQEVLAQLPQVEPFFVRVMGTKEAVSKATGVVVYLASSDLRQAQPLLKKPVVLDRVGQVLTLKTFPEKVRVLLSPYPKVRKMVEVKPKFESKERGEEALLHYRIDPAFVWALGEPAQVLTLQSAFTKPLNLARMEGDNFEIELEPVKGVEFEPEKVTVKVTMGKRE